MKHSSLAVLILTVSFILSGCGTMPTERYQESAWEPHSAQELEENLQYLGYTPDELQKIIPLYDLRIKDIPEESSLQILGSVSICDLDFQDMRFLYQDDGKEVYGLSYCYTQDTPTEQDLIKIHDIYDFICNHYGDPITENVSNRVKHYIPTNENKGYPIYKDFWEVPEYPQVQLSLELQDMSSSKDSRMTIIVVFRQIQIPNIDTTSGL